MVKRLVLKKLKQPLFKGESPSLAVLPFRSMFNGIVFTGLCVGAFIAGAAVGFFNSPAAAEKTYANVPTELEVYYAPIPEVKLESSGLGVLDPLSYKAFEKSDLTGIDESQFEALKHIKADAVSFITGHYRKVDTDTAKEIVEQAFISGRKHNVDPLLILAIIANESSFNPNSRSRADAAGLMQVHLKVHASRFKKYGGTQAAYQIEPAIEEGTQILKEYLKRTGTLTGALKYYVGAANKSADGGYARKVLSTRKNLQIAVAGNVEAAHIRARAPSRMPLDLMNNATYATYENGTNIERTDGSIKTTNALNSTTNQKNEI